MKTKIVLDTSIIIDGEISKKIDNNEINENYEIIIPRAVIDELQSQACKQKEYGTDGLLELKKIREKSIEKKIDVNYAGEKPSLAEIKLAKNGRIDAIINDIAKNENATLFTADYIQHLVADATGILNVHKKTEISEEYDIESYFDERTMSVHLIEGIEPLAKKGTPGNFVLEKISNEKLDKTILGKVIDFLFSVKKNKRISNIEIAFEGCFVIMYKNLRIVITQQPISNKIEITAVRPIRKLSLSDYDISDDLINRLSNEAEGILIAGPPGSGKSTFASSIAEHYVLKNKLVKTLESPRDLQVPDSVVQYGSFKNGYERVSDLLLLVRPDFTIFDEVRKIKDFELFADLRLTGIGMIGVIHASKALDAIQRFIGKIELGMIPHIIDTVIFILEGKIKKIYELDLTVKVPSGMTEQDLARPIVEIKDFFSKETEYEIYSYGEENVIIPLENIDKKTGSTNNKINKLAEAKIKEIINRFDSQAEIKIVSNDRVKISVNKEVIPKIIGKGGSTISEIEKKLGISIDVEAKNPAIGDEMQFSVTESGAHIYFILDDNLIGKKINLVLDDEIILSNLIGKKARLKIDKKSEAGGKVLNAILGNNLNAIKLFESG
ncbi:MAG: Flp pilus assembly complex ATPase component TadA [Thermoproteota archaeon]|nr:Flp pilus assembly complex ATPase component TadA [Thermoproteota archaeon]